MAEKFYLTTAITYTSRKPHIGNTYEIVLSDAIVRFKRMLGYDTYFLTGTDEHGQKIEGNAIQNNMTPREYVDKVAGEVKSIWDMMNTSYDQFIRTTDEKHVKSVQKIFKKLYDQGDIYKSAYEGNYCVACESFFTDTQLAEGCCPDCGGPVKLTKEEAYFFKMSKYQDRLMKHIEDNPDFICPESRKREMVNNFLKPGLQDLCVSRTSFQWGIPVTFDDRHVIYVWIDALSNYITALDYDVDGSGALYKKYWPCDVHVIGKDILRFHTIYWPIILMALGEPLPKQVFGHPWLMSGVDKMSKSKGNVMYADDLVHHFGVDGVRYYLLSEMPYAQDGTITYQNIITRYNSDLANTLGNLVNRTVAMIQKYFGGTVARPPVSSDSLDKALADTAIDAVERYTALMNGYKTADALDAVMDVARRSNKYIDETMPWALAKDEDKRDRLSAVLYNLAEAIRFIAVLTAPLLPETGSAILTQLGSPTHDYASLASFGAVEKYAVGDAVPLFARIDEAKKLAEISGETMAKAAPAQPKDKPESKAVPGVITIDDFKKVALCTATVTACVPVEKSDKLLKLTLDDGMSARQVVSGIAKWYTPDDLIGKKLIVVANLKPVKLRGVESNGMILAADIDGRASVVFVDAAVPNGSVVR
ncbi:MAG: methionine--tRNA ligase [Acetanaerobacterium sp.]